MKKNFLARINRFLSKITTISFVIFCVVQIFLSIVASITSIEVNAESQQSNNIFTGTFTACEFADTGTAAFLECISQITGYALLIGIVYFFAKIGYLFLINFSFFDSSKASVYQIFKESINDLIVGIVLIGMPVTILGAINPLSRLLTFSFIQEMNLGERANLIDVTPNLRGCPGFAACIQNCKFSREGNSLRQCVTKCKSDYVDCQLCHEFIDEEGNGLRDADFLGCINPQVPSNRDELPNQNGSSLSCGENSAVVDNRNGFVKLRYTPYISQNKKPNGEDAPSPYKNNSCGAASAVMIVEAARPGTFPCLDSQKLSNFTGDQNDYCLYTYMWRNDNYQVVNMADNKRSALYNKTSGRSCKGAFGITTGSQECRMSDHAGRDEFLKYFDLTISHRMQTADFDAIRDQINSGLPLFISVAFSSGSSHIMTIVGYRGSDRSLLLNDPWQYENRNVWGSSRLMEVKLSADGKNITGYPMATTGILYIETISKTPDFQPVPCSSSTNLI